MDFELEYYVLTRNDYGDREYETVSVTPDNDPLYGRGSWDIYAGPFTSVEQAEEATPVFRWPISLP